MLNFLRRLYYSGDTARYLKNTEDGLSFWVERTGFKPGTPPEIVIDWCLEHDQDDMVWLLTEYVELRDFCQRRLGV